MADIIPFKKPALKEKHRGNSLCKNNHHKWILLKDSHFDSKQGRLVTSWRCQRCGKIKTKGL